MKAKDFFKPFIRIAMVLFRVFPIDQHKVVFSSFSARSFSDNPRYIAEKIIEDKLPLDCVVVLNNKNEIGTLPTGIRGVKYNSIRYLYEMATAKVWIDNTRKQPHILKRKKQFYIQTWHGGLSFKKVEKDAINSLDEEYIKTAINDSKNIDVLLTNSVWGFEQLRRCFWYDGEITITGSPRLDILFNYKKSDVIDLKNEFNIGSDEHVVLYAPTFRKKDDFSVYNVDFKKMAIALHERFGGKWKVLVKLHPNIKDKGYIPPDGVMDVTQFPDINKLYIITDILLTDYSSSILDFMITYRPAFLFAVDIDDYTKDRDTYFDLHSLPFLLSESNDELMNNIKQFDPDIYEESLYRFLDTLGVKEDGHASNRVVEMVMKAVNE